MGARSSRIRLNLALSIQTKDLLDRLCKASEAKTMAEVIRRALTLYEEYINVTKCGGRFIIKEQGEDPKTLRIL